MVLSGLIIIFMGLQMALETYLILFCKETLLCPVITAGYFLSITHLGGIIGRLTWGPMSDFFFKGRRKTVLMMTGGLSSVMCMSFAFISPRFPIWSIVVLAFLFGSCALGWNGMYHTLLVELAGKDQAGIGTGVSLSIGFLGVLLGPPFFGYIVDHTGTYFYGWLIFSLMVGLTTPFIGLIREPKS